MKWYKLVALTVSVLALAIVCTAIVSPEQNEVSDLMRLHPKVIQRDGDVEYHFTQPASDVLAALPGVAIVDGTQRPASPKVACCSSEFDLPSGRLARVQSNFAYGHGPGDGSHFTVQIVPYPRHLAELAWMRIRYRLHLFGGTRDASSTEW